MKKISCLVVLAAVLPVAAWADCTYPKKPAKAPDGARSTREEMVAAKKVNDQYQTDVTDYLKCMKDEHEAALAKIDPAAKNAEDEKKKLTQRWEKKNDAAVDEAQDVADRFNQQLAAFKAKASK